MHLERPTVVSDEGLCYKFVVVVFIYFRGVKVDQPITTEI